MLAAREPAQSPTRLPNVPGVAQQGCDAPAQLSSCGIQHHHELTSFPEGQVTSSLLHTHQFPPVKVPWMMLLCAWGANISLTPRGTRLCPCPPRSPGKTPSPFPSHPWGPRRGPALTQPPPKLPSPFPHKRDPLPTASAALHLPPGSAPAWHGLSSFSSLSHSLNALCLLWRRGAGRAPLPLPAPGDPPRQMGPGYECAHSEAPKRICWRPFHCKPLCAAPLRWDAPEFSPGFSPFHSRRKESAYKGLVCPTCLRGPYCCRCRGSWRDSVAPLRKGDVRLPPGRVRAGGLARRWEKRFQLHFNVH